MFQSLTKERFSQRLLSDENLNKNFHSLAKTKTNIIRPFQLKIINNKTKPKTNILKLDKRYFQFKIILSDKNANNFFQILTKTKTNKIRPFQLQIIK